MLSFLLVLSVARGLVRPASLQLNNDGTLSSFIVAGVSVDSSRIQRATLLATDTAKFGYNAATAALPPLSVYEAFNSPAVTQGPLGASSLAVSLPTPMLWQQQRKKRNHLSRRRDLTRVASSQHALCVS